MTSVAVFCGICGCSASASARTLEAAGTQLRRPQGQVGVGLAVGTALAVAGEERASARRGGRGASTHS